MIENHERRESVRIDHTSVLKIVDLESGKVHRARMLNYSKNGLYFETDSDLRPGNKISIAIQDSPYAEEPGVVEYYDAEIMWRKKFEDAFFDFGYGVALIPSSDKQESKNTDLLRGENANKISEEANRMAFEELKAQREHRMLMVEPFLQLGRLIEKKKMFFPYL